MVSAAHPEFYKQTPIHFLFRCKIKPALFCFSFRFLLNDQQQIAPISFTVVLRDGTKMANCSENVKDCHWCVCLCWWFNGFKWMGPLRSEVLGHAKLSKKRQFSIFPILVFASYQHLIISQQRLQTRLWMHQCLPSRPLYLGSDSWRQHSTECKNHAVSTWKDLKSRIGRKRMSVKKNRSPVVENEAKDIKLTEKQSQQIQQTSVRSGSSQINLFFFFGRQTREMNWSI